jgi:small GTP-binding protein
MTEDKLKIVVFGAFGAGKTTLIRTLDPGSQHIEAPCGSGTTTIALDYGRVNVDGRHVYLFGTPGQERFEAAREVIGRGMDGAILLIDTTSPCDEFVRHLHESLCSARIPFIVMLNRCGEVGSQPDSIRQMVTPSPVAVASAKDRRQALTALQLFVSTLPEGQHMHNHGMH